MSILAALPFTPVRTRIATATIRNAPWASVDEIEQLLSPTQLDPGNAETSIARDVLRQLVRLEIIKMEGGSTGKYRVSIKNPDNVIVEIGERLLGSDSEDPFAFALAWYLSQDAFVPFDKDQKSALVREQLGDHWLATMNVSRFENLLYWARALGFLSMIPATVTGTEASIPDPTVAIRNVLPRLFGEKKELPVADFMNGLGGACSVLEGGVWRDKVEAIMSGVLARAHNQISPSTSLALKRLFFSGHLKLDRHADAEVYTLAYPDNQEEITHIRLEKRGK